MESLFEFYPAPGITNERMYVFVARDLEPGEPAREPNEQIENYVVAYDEALAMIHRGEIHDGKTMLTLLIYARQLGIASR
jgi:ADP-ribose pyrophosphatase